MIYYEDLLSCKFKINGRDPAEGLDCYGLVLECTKRDGHPLRDFIAQEEKTAGAEDWDFYAQRLNIELIDEPEAGAIAQYISGDTLHLVYFLDKERVLQMTYNGVRITPRMFVENQHDYILMRVQKQKD